MFCNACGKPNPVGAKFCAYCGAKLLSVEQEEPAAADAPVAPEPAPAESIPAEAPAAAEAAAPATSQYAEPAAPRSTVRPVGENPVQPFRPGDLPPIGEPLPQEEEPIDAPEAAPATEELPPFVQDEEPDELAWPDDDLAEEEGKPFLRRFFTPKPDDDEPDELAEWPDEPEPEATTEDAPRKFNFPGLSPAQRRRNNLVLTSSGEEELPARKRPVTRERRDTHVPKRIVPGAREAAEPTDETDEDLDGEDIFFMKPKKRAAGQRRRAEEDASLDDAYVNSRVRAILFGIVFALCVALAFWLFATTSGKVFRAGFGLSADAQSYRILGDRALANNQVRRAADAYYQALALEPDNYSTALLVGATQQQIGSYDTAIRAYMLCISLRPDDPEPYYALARLYETRGDADQAAYYRQLAAQAAGSTGG